MLTRRVIACLDVRDGRVVKGVRFRGLRDVGDPVALARRYAQDGIDELCFLDVAASVENRGPLLDLIRRVSEQLFIPFSVGGGFRSAEDARAALRAGADKVSLNTAALLRPELLTELAREFGRQCVVLSIDTRLVGDRWKVTTHGGRQDVDRECLDWAAEGVSRGAGEILLNVIDTDGTHDGFRLDITREVAARLPVPVIASGGAGGAAHFAEVFRETAVSGALAASIFHDEKWTPRSLKHYLAERGIEVRA